LVDELEEIEERVAAYLESILERGRARKRMLDLLKQAEKILSEEIELSRGKKKKVLEKLLGRLGKVYEDLRKALVI